MGGGKKYSYRIFGLIVHSEIEFPELLEAVGEPDVTIRIISLSEEYFHYGMVEESFWRSSLECFFLNIKDIGRYLVKKGNVIYIHPAPHCQPAALRVFVLGTCMGVLLHQRGILPIHASGISTQYGCVMFSGISGIGKSTIATAFHARGYSIVADDICAIKLNRQGVPIVLSAYPQVKITTDSAAMLGVNVRRLIPVEAALNKFRLPVTDAFQQNETVVHKIYFLSENKVDQPVFREIHGNEKILSLIVNTYRREVLRGLGKIEEHFQVCRAVGKQFVAVSLMRQPKPKFFGAFVDDIENDFNQP